MRSQKASLDMMVILPPIISLCSLSVAVINLIFDFSEILCEIDVEGSIVSRLEIVSMAELEKKKAAIKSKMTTELNQAKSDYDNIVEKTAADEQVLDEKIASIRDRATRDNDRLNKDSLNDVTSEVVSARTRMHELKKARTGQFEIADDGQQDMQRQLYVDNIKKYNDHIRKASADFEAGLEKAMGMPEPQRMDQINTLEKTYKFMKDFLYKKKASLAMMFRDHAEQERTLLAGQ